jgi:hypothetical protein
VEIIRIKAQDKNKKVFWENIEDLNIIQGKYLR